MEAFLLLVVMGLEQRNELVVVWDLNRRLLGNKSRDRDLWFVFHFDSLGRGNKEAEFKLQSSKYLSQTNTHTGSCTDREMAEADTRAFSNELYPM